MGKIYNFKKNKKDEGKNFDIEKFWRLTCIG
jgi:hypothetical protein